MQHATVGFYCRVRLLLINSNRFYYLSNDNRSLTILPPLLIALR